MYTKHSTVFNYLDTKNNAHQWGYILPLPFSLTLLEVIFIEQTFLNSKGFVLLLSMSITPAEFVVTAKSHK